MLNLRFLGAARTTTGSMHCVECDGRRVLLDCGLLQGHRKEAFEANRAMPFPRRRSTRSSSPTPTSTTAAASPRS